MMGFFGKKTLLSPRDVVDRMISVPAARQEIWDVAINRGMGEGMQIEKWLLIEMLAQLKALQSERILSDVEGECKYPLIKSSRFEHCDFWWKGNENEHWLEVKTILIGEYQSRGGVPDIERDLEKRHSLEEGDIFHHLAVIFPMQHNDIRGWRHVLDPVYANAEMEFRYQWNFPLRAGRQLVVWLYSAD